MNRDFFDALSASLREAVSMAKDANILLADSELSGQDASQDRADVHPVHEVNEVREGATSENRPSEVD